MGKYLRNARARIGVLAVEDEVMQLGLVDMRPAIGDHPACMPRKLPELEVWYPLGPPILRAYTLKVLQGILSKGVYQMAYFMMCFVEMCSFGDALHTRNAIV